MSTESISVFAPTQNRWLRLTWIAHRPSLGTEGLIVLGSMYFTLFSNTAFWRAAITAPLQEWRFALSLFVVVTAVHAFLLGLVVNRRTAKPLLTLLLLITATASY